METIASCDERLYATFDARYSVTGLVSASGSVVERFAYSPYGLRFIYDANYSWYGGSVLFQTAYETAPDPGFQGLRTDPFFSLINRHRITLPALGRFAQRDPLGYVDGANLYEYVRGNPVNGLDPEGTITWRVIKDSCTVEMYVSLKLNFTGAWTPNRELAFQGHLKSAVESTFNGSFYVTL